VTWSSRCQFEGGGLVASRRAWRLCGTGCRARGDSRPSRAGIGSGAGGRRYANRRVRAPGRGFLSAGPGRIGVRAARHNHRRGDRRPAHPRPGRPRRPAARAGGRRPRLAAHVAGLTHPAREARAPARGGRRHARALAAKEVRRGRAARPARGGLTAGRSRLSDQLDLAQTAASTIAPGSREVRGPRRCRVPASRSTHRRRIAADSGPVG
jgi:hypothetical protein